MVGKCSQYLHNFGGGVLPGAYVVSRVPDSLAVRRESGQTVYYVSCKAVQEIFGVLIGLSTVVTYCDSLLRIKLVS